MSKAPSGITFIYGQAAWPERWFSVRIPKSSTTTELAAVKRYLSAGKFIVQKEKQIGKEIVMYGNVEEGVSLWEASSQMKKKFSCADLRAHYHTKPVALRTDKEKEYLKKMKEERTKRAPIVFGVPYILKDEYDSRLTSIIVFYKQIKGRFCAIRAELWDHEPANTMPQWRLTRYGCHEVKNILEQCKVQDLSFMVLHGSLTGKVKQVVDEQLATWHLIKDVMDKAPRTADGRKEELVKYEKGPEECPASTESTVSP